MPKAAAIPLQPRKTPVQARSSASVDAILQATIQVLVAVGKERLTTTLVAQRAGVSVGTLYQYFPNKSALLQACLKRHMGDVSAAIERVCREQSSASIFDMATQLIHGFLAAKFYDLKASTTLYSVSSDIDGIAIARAVSTQIHRKVTDLFATAREPLNKEPELAATMVLAAINGTTRKLLEEKSPEKRLTVYREELLHLVHTYLQTCIAA